LLAAGQPGADRKTLAADCLRSLEKARIQAEIEALTAQLARPDLTFEQASSLQQHIRELDLRKRLSHIPAPPIS
jgi:hypothetical protein